jgi:hypothetical protein
MKVFLSVYFLTVTIYFPLKVARFCTVHRLELETFTSVGLFMPSEDFWEQGFYIYLFLTVFSNSVPMI